MKRFILPALMSMLTCIAVQAKQPTEGLPSIGFLKVPDVDVGCNLTFRDDKRETEQYILVSTHNKVRMNLNGKDTEISPLSSPDAPGPQIYKFNDARIIVNYGESKEVEGGGSYPKATITITRNGQSRTIKAKGYCGC